MDGAVPPLPNTPSWRGAQLGGAQGQLYLSTYDIQDKIMFDRPLSNSE
jgi:hypothetical protein